MKKPKKTFFYNLNSNILHININDREMGHKESLMRGTDIHTSKFYRTGEGPDLMDGTILYYIVNEYRT